MDNFEEFFLKSRQSELERYSRIFASKQSLSVSALPGSGKSLFFTKILPDYLKKLHPDQFQINLFSILDSRFTESLYDLEFDKKDFHLIILDDLTSVNIKPSFLPLWDYLWAKRTALSRRLIFLFLTNQPLEPSLFGQIGFCYLENQINFSPSTLEETRSFIHELSPHHPISTQQINQIHSISSGNFRLIKSIVKELQAGITLDELLSSPSSSRITFFFNQLLSDTSLTSKELQNQFPQFNLYLSSTASQNFDFSLTSLEKSFFDLLSKNLGQLVSRQSAIENVWPEAKQFELYDHSLDQLVYRLKTKIKHRYRLKSIKGRGFVLN